MHKSVLEEHTELYHYTTAVGLHGIISSQQLWATHASYLNDAEEITGFFDRKFPRLLENTVRNAVAEKAKTAEGRTHIDSFGGEGKAATTLLHDLPNIFRNHTLSFNQPYITSFCTSLPERIRHDGLLSQWRAYGPDGGYAIVFDTQGLEELLNDEFSRYYYQSGLWGDVEYYDHGGEQYAALPEVREREVTLLKAIEQFILTMRPDAFETTFEAITALSTMHKHIGFREESEVRIVAVPANAELLKESQKAGDNKLKKPIQFASRNGILVPYIALFERLSNNHAAKLPIIKVIVGPHPEKRKRQQAVELLLDQFGIRAEVSVSGIPYLGR
jgi:hypothetical protein